MKKVKNLIIILLLFIIVGVTAGIIIYNSYLGSVSNSSDIVEVEIPKNTSSPKIASILEEKNLIKNKEIFKLYLKINKVNDLKAGHYKLSYNMDVKEIVEVLRKGNNYNPNEIKITFREGINMRKIAKIIDASTNNSYDSVMETIKDKKYLEELINKYWFINKDILNNKIYYSLEGYLYPDTYIFKNKDVTVKEIFTKLLDQMDKVLDKYRPDIEKNKYSMHELLTVASICELEVSNKYSDGYRKLVASVFYNRLNKGMSLGSDITTRYSIKLDDKRALTRKEYNSINDYNTRSSTMSGKLPVGPIGMVSKSSIEASIYPDKTDYIYFISNIKTGETFFYKYSKDFEKKKVELAPINGGY